MHPTYLRTLATALVLSVLPVLALAATAETEAEPTAAAETGEVTTSLPEFSSARQITLDPRTGRRVAGGSTIALDARTRNLLSRSSEGLFETASPASGVMVNLRGRMRSAVFADSSQGEPLVIDCITHLDSNEEPDHE